MSSGVPSEAASADESAATFVAASTSASTPRAASEMQTHPAPGPGVVRLPTGMGFEVDNDDEADAATFVADSAAAAPIAPRAKDKDVEEPSQVTPPVLPPAPIVTPAQRRISEPVMLAQPTPARVPTPVQTVRIEPEPAPLLPPPMVVPTYPSAAPYTKEQQLASGSSALKNEDVAVASRAPLGDGSSITPTGVHREQTNEPARRKLPVPLLVGAAAVAATLLVVVIVLAKGGGTSAKSETAKSKRDHASTKTVAAGESKGSASESESVSASETPDPEPGESSPGGAGSAKSPGKKAAAGSGAAASEMVPGEGSGSDATVASNPPTQIPSPPPAVAKRPATLGGKKVVLEYDTTTPKDPPKKTAAAPVDENAVRSARTAYFNGNKKLFAGDANGAIKLYQQALGVYPGYVAGYRGLGLAYAQKGDKKNALKAFRTYLTAVPTAKDIALIKQRMATLQR